MLPIYGESKKAREKSMFWWKAEQNWSGQELWCKSWKVAMQWIKMKMEKCGIKTLTIQTSYFCSIEGSTQVQFYLLYFQACHIFPEKLIHEKRMMS